jgi:hypothetical protein
VPAEVNYIKLYRGNALISSLAFSILIEWRSIASGISRKEDFIQLPGRWRMISRAPRLPLR